MLIILSSCQKEIAKDKLFSEMPAATTGIDFENKLDIKNPDFNIYKCNSVSEITYNWGKNLIVDKELF